MKPINYKALGAKIKEYRKKENITQEQLAEMADISLSHMNCWWTVTARNRKNIFTARRWI